MTLPADFIATMPEDIASVVSTKITGLRNCHGMVGRFDVQQLRSKSMVAPAVLVSRTDIRPDKTRSGPLRSFTASMAAFVVTRDTMGVSRDIASGVIVQALLELVPDQTWGMPNFMPAKDVSASVLINANTDKLNLHLAAVTWKQPFYLNAAPPVEPVDFELLVNPHIYGELDAGGLS